MYLKVFFKKRKNIKDNETKFFFVVVSLKNHN